jgi:hypothetical protein
MIFFSWDTGEAKFFLPRPRDGQWPGPSPLLPPPPQATWQHGIPHSANSLGSVFCFILVMFMTPHRRQSCSMLISNTQFTRKNGAHRDQVGVQQRDHQSKVTPNSQAQTLEHEVPRIGYYFHPYGSWGNGLALNGAGCVWRISQPLMVGVNDLSLLSVLCCGIVCEPADEQLFANGNLLSRRNL